MFTIAVPPQFSHVDASGKFESVAKAKTHLLKQGLSIQDIELCVFDTDQTLENGLKMKAVDSKRKGK